MTAPCRSIWDPALEHVRLTTSNRQTILQSGRRQLIVGRKMALYKCWIMQTFLKSVSSAWH